MNPSDGGGMQDKPDIQLAAAIALVRNRVLIVRRSTRESFLPGVWGVPCGKVDKGEDPQVAVLRELKEETGLDGEVIDFVGKSFFYSGWRGRKVLNVQNNYLVRPKDSSVRSRAARLPEVKLPEEDQQYQWVSADKIESVGLLDNHNLGAIRQGLNGAKSRVPVS